MEPSLYFTPKVSSCELQYLPLTELIARKIRYKQNRTRNLQKFCDSLIQLYFKI